MTTDIRSDGSNPVSAHSPREGADPEHSGKRPYHPPRLQALGDLRGLTLGGSAVPSDSGSNLRRDPTNPTSGRL
jgi:hypothetical protein